MVTVHLLSAITPNTAAVFRLPPFWPFRGALVHFMQQTVVGSAAVGLTATSSSNTVAHGEPATPSVGFILKVTVFAIIAFLS